MRRFPNTNISLCVCLFLVHYATTGNSIKHTFQRSLHERISLSLFFSIFLLFWRLFFVERSPRRTSPRLDTVLAAMFLAGATPFHRERQLIHVFHGSRGHCLLIPVYVLHRQFAHGYSIYHSRDMRHHLDACLLPLLFSSPPLPRCFRENANVDVNFGNSGITKERHKLLFVENVKDRSRFCDNFYDELRIQTLPPSREFEEVGN